MDENTYEEEQGLTIGEYFRIILKKIWWVLGAAAVGLILAALIVGLWYNKSDRTYSIDFRISYANEDMTTYPDGTAIDVSDSVNLSVLNEIKEGKYSEEDSKDEFKSVDVEEMVKQNDITFAVTLPTTDTSGDDAVIYTHYTVTVPVKYFDNDEQGYDFLNTIANYTMNRMNTVLTDEETGIAYGKYLEKYDSAKDKTAYKYTTFTELLNMLVQQKTYMTDMYSELEKVVGSKVSTKLLELENILTTTEQTSIKNTINGKLLQYNYEQYLEDALNEIEGYTKSNEDIEKQLDAQKAARDEAYESIKNNIGTSSSSVTVVLDTYDEKISELTSKYSENEVAIQNIYKTINAAFGRSDIDSAKDITDLQSASTEFAADYKSAVDAMTTRLDAIKATLEAATEEMKTIVIAAYTDNAKVTINSLATDGGMNVALAALIGALIGLVIAAVVVCIIDAPAYRRAKYGIAEPALPVATADAASTEPASGEKAETVAEDKVAEKGDKKD